MSKKKRNATRVAAEPKMIDLIVTQEYLDANPELVLEGIEVGQTISVPDETEEEETEDEVVEDFSSKLPEWAKSEGVVATKEEVAAFDTVEMVKPVKKDEIIPDWAKA